MDHSLGEPELNKGSLIEDFASSNLGDEVSIERAISVE